MGKSVNNEYAEGFSGKIGRNMVFRQLKNGDVGMARKPRKKKGPAHIKHLEARKLFKKAALYAQQVEADPVMKEMYSAAAKGLQSAFNLALRDARVAPKVTKIDTSEYEGQIGDRIIIDAEDDFKVARVDVSIHDANGVLLERGNAVIPPLSMDWVYTTTVVNAQLPGTTITATAFDMPGNKGALVTDL